MANAGRSDLHALRDQAEEVHRGLQEALEATAEEDPDARHLEAAVYLTQRVATALRRMRAREWRRARQAGAPRNAAG